MSEAPKRIWITNAQQRIVWTSDPNDPPFPEGMNPVRSTIYIRADIAEEMRQKLNIAAQVFRAYQAHHEYKEGGVSAKSERNKGYAEQMEEALKLLEDQG